MQMEEKCVKRFDMVEGSFTLEPDKGINIDKLLKIFIQYLKTVQAKKHKKKRINKKWIKRYGYKQKWFNSKGWKLKSYKDGTAEFVK